MTFIINAIFTGTWGITVVLLVFQLFRLKLQINPVIVKSVSTLLLVGASLYIFKILLYFLINYNLGGQDDPYNFRNGNLLSFLIVYVAWLFSFGLVPQILWLKKLRGRFLSLLIIVGIWAITRLFIPWRLFDFFTERPVNLNFKFEFSFLDYLEQIAVYTAAFVMLFSIKSRKDSEIESSINGQM